MEYVAWKFEELEIAVVEDDAGDLWCTSLALCSALAISYPQLRKMCERHPEQLNPRTVTDCHNRGQEALVQFIGDNRAKFGIKLLRKDSLIWHLDEALTVAYLARTSVGWRFIKSSISLVKERAQRGRVSAQQHAELEAQNFTLLARIGRYEIDLQNLQEQSVETQQQVRRLEDKIERMEEPLRLAASSAGRGLQAAKAYKEN